MGDDTVVEVLREAELCITNLLRRIKAGEDAKKRENMTSTSYEVHGKDFTGGLEELSLEESLSMSRPFNQRIDLSFEAEEREMDLQFEHDEIGHGLEDDELTRDKVKRASSQILQAVDRKKRRPKKAAGASVAAI